jgi:AcrR family transcriptional regulator
MPRDASDTRARLLTEAERLFAVRGYHQTTTREITEAAGQRNVSAITYHFGTREGLLTAILLQHGSPLDEERAERASGSLDRLSTRDLVAALTIPYAAQLGTQRGRYYLRIVAQLTDLFPMWREQDELRPPQLRRLLTALERRAPGAVRVRRERLIGVIMLMTAMTADRARQIDEDPRLHHDQEQFVSNLVDMLAGIVETPIGDRSLAAQSH